MYVVAVHTISDPQTFYSAIQEGASELPPGLSVQSMAPSRDGSKAVCVWEADSMDSVRSLVEETVGESSSNEFYEVDDAKAIGLGS